MRVALFQRSFTIIIALFVSGLITVGFSIAFYNNHYPLMNNHLSLAPVDDILVKEDPRVGIITEITIQGILCCPCYSIYTHTINKIDLERQEIQIYLWQQKIAEICIMITVHYEYQFDIIFLSSGDWTINVNSKTFHITVQA